MSTAIGVKVDESYSADEMKANGKGFAVGNRYESQDGKVYIFCQANGAITGDGYVVSIDESRHCR